ncbi:MAG: MFS transporter [Candidatus Latescibacteria bacterium]|nr:MFS transporter [Candidatus Latescibacterota bacterium]
MDDSRATRRSALLVATLSSFLNPFMASSVNIALPSIGREFAVDAVLLSWIPTAYLLSVAVFLIPFGRAGDIYGRKKVFTYGTSIFTASTLLLSVASSVGELIAFRVLQGIGSAMIFGTSVAILSSVFPASERGRALGVTVAAVYSGLSAGPFLGGFLAQQFGWRSIFWAALPLGLLILGIVRWKLKDEWAESRGEPFDLWGALFYGVSLVAIMDGFAWLPGIRGVALIVAGLLGLGAFVRWEMRVAHPVLGVHLFRGNRVFAFSSLAAMINYSATFAVGFLLSLYLQYVRGFTPQRAGLILVAQPVVQALFSPFAGRLSDRIEPRTVASVGMAFTAIGLFLLAFLREKTALEFIVLSLVFLGFGFALFSSPNANAIMGAVEKRFYGVASGVLGTTRMLGQMLSMGIVTLIFAIHLQGCPMTPESAPLLLKSAKTAFIAFATLCCCGILASLSRGKMR